MELSLKDLREILNPSLVPAGALPVVRRQILIGERGWVWVGDVAADGEDYVLTNASVIRVWGTTAGLGELALGGKQAKTILDPCGTIRVPKLATLGRIDVAPGVSL